MSLITVMVDIIYNGNGSLQCKRLL